MTLSILNGLLQRYLNSLLDEGVVNGRFSEIVSLNTTGERNRVVQMINNYIADVDVILDELSLHIDRSEADFTKVASLAREVEEKSRSIGAEHMRLACSNLINACVEKNKISYSLTLPWIRREFATTRSKLDAFVQMERRIIRCENQQSQN